MESIYNAPFHARIFLYVVISTCWNLSFFTRLPMRGVVFSVVSALLGFHTQDHVIVYCRKYGYFLVVILGIILVVLL
jgi:hypothetical protein